MKPAIYDPSGRPVYWRSDDNQIYRVHDPSRLNDDAAPSQLIVTVQTTEPTGQLVEAAPTQEPVVLLAAEGVAPPELWDLYRTVCEIDSEDAKDVSRQLYELLVDPKRRQRAETIDRLGGSSVIQKAKTLAASASGRHIKQYLDGLRQRPVM